MYQILKSLLFLLPPERAHKFTMGLLELICKVPFGAKIVSKIYSVESPLLEITVAGIKFPNVVGLAAGFDKNAEYIDAIESLGFGFIELGTVTPLAQEGNPKPRLFRLPEDQALINRMGFNNIGLDTFVKNLKRANVKVPLGGNIGKNKITPNEDAVHDYDKGFAALYPHVDYFTINVSSPNTPNLRELQEKEPLTKLLTHLQTLNQATPKPKPMFLKIAPDISNEQLDQIIDIIHETGLAGVIATNTTINRENLKTNASDLEKIGNGGLSGLPLEKRSTEVIRQLANRSRGEFAIIGVGGIHSAEDALEKLEAGADLVQIYTGFIYQGPGLIKRINKAVLKMKE